jgi:2-aminoethylphosphonate-pyruvate transaminase
MENYVTYPSNDKPLFTPGPLTTSPTVKQAMLHDLGSRDTAFIEIVRDVRRRLVALGEADPVEYTAVLMQGSGTFGIEAVLSSAAPAGGKLLILINGAYGERMLKIAQVHQIPVAALRCPENEVIAPQGLEQILAEDPAVTHVAVVHCETTTGLINPVERYGEIAGRYGKVYIVDAMSSFGAYLIPLAAWGVDFLVSSSNKCIEGVPGFSFVLARRERLQAAQGQARSLSLDLYAQWAGLEGDGQFRFTPPVHAILAFHQALLELEQEGGVAGRAARYRRNYALTLAGMQALGFRAYLPEAQQGYIITSFEYFDHPNFKFSEFYERLSAKGQVIYPGKLSHADCFRIGHIGRLDERHVQALLAAVAETLAEMGIGQGKN